MDRAALPGILFWIVFLPLAALGLINPTWYVDWTRADWINLGVAGGTLALAAITAWNVSVTRSVLSAEDRRHRQSLAPIVDMWATSGAFSLVSLHLINNGPGPALKLQIKCLATYFRGQEEVETSMTATRAVLAPKVSGDDSITIELELPDALIIERLKEIHVSYSDMFGNPYQSHRVAGVFTWEPPQKLQ
jgi:hypothetical protein